jgi:hypothetical protein
MAKDAERAAFTPVGGEARWKVVYRLLERRSVGDTLTYEAIGAALDLDPRRERWVIYPAVRRAATVYLDSHLRALVAVPNVGYRVVAPSEHLQLARDHNKKAGKELERGYQVATQVDLTDVDPEVRKGLELLALGLSQQQEINRRQARTNAKMAKAMEATATKVERTAEQVDEVMERMARLEERVSRRNAAQRATEAAELAQDGS